MLYNLVKNGSEYNITHYEVRHVYINKSDLMMRHPLQLKHNDANGITLVYI